MFKKDVILVINTGYFGDVLVTSKLTRDAKKIFPEKKIVFICDKPYYNVAKNLPGVDEVFIYDRKKDPNPINFIKFVLKFPYKYRILHTFIGHQKTNLKFLSRMLGGFKITDWQTILTSADFLAFVKEHTNHEKISYKNADMLKALTGKYTDDCDIEFCVPQDIQEEADNFVKSNGLKNLVGINPQANSDWKCWDVNEFLKFCHKLIDSGYTPMITGVSKDGSEYIDALNKEPAEYKDKYVNLIDKTTFVSLGAYYKNCKAVVSVDTGSAHMAIAVGTQTNMLFFKPEYPIYWSPINQKKNHYIEKPKISAEEVFDLLKPLLKAEVNV